MATVDVSDMLWSLVGVVISMPYDDVTGTGVFHSFCDLMSADQQRWRDAVDVVLPEASFVSWDAACAALDAAGAGVPVGVAFDRARSVYRLADVEALFAGMRDVAIAVLQAARQQVPGVTDVPTNCLLRLEAFCACVRRMDAVVDVNTLALDLGNKLSGPSACQQRP